MMPARVAGLQLGSREVAFAGVRQRCNARWAVSIASNINDIGRILDISCRPATPAPAGAQWLRFDVAPKKLQACNFAVEERISTADRRMNDDARSATGGTRVSTEAIRQVDDAPVAQGERDGGL